MEVSTLATFFSGISFLFFGTSCLTSAYMKSEFIRYGFDRQRELTGYLQVLGGLGLLIGYWLTPLLAFLAAVGLALMMLVGFGVRLKIRDSFWASSPAFIFAALNIYLCLHYYAALP